MDMPDTDEWRDFLDVSARLGSDITLVQAAGGNTSIKLDDTLWIKASGTWLSEARDRPVMVPVDLDRLRARLAAGTLAESDLPDLTGQVAGLPAMRASVETPFHALFEARCVLHVHCVATIAEAIRPDARTRLAARLEGYDWHWQPYVKPGVPLTDALRDGGAAGAEVVVLGNHGLIVTGATPREAEARLLEVRDRLSAPTRVTEELPAPPMPDLEGSGYHAAEDAACHALARDPVLLADGGACAFAPDFVVFFGPRIPVLDPGPDLHAQLVALARQSVPLNAVVILAGHGVLLRDTAMRGTLDLLHGYRLVLEQHRARGGGYKVMLTDEQANDLLGWEAEKYRQGLNGLAGAERAT